MWSLSSPAGTKQQPLFLAGEVTESDFIFALS
jgi:hypothetical protein